MSTRTLDKSQCQAYFDRVSRELGAKEAEIEIAGLGIGSQIGHEWTLLRGITYDPRNDTVEVVTDDLDHLIPHPREVHVEDGVDGLHSVQVLDADGNRQIIKLRSPLLLGADGGTPRH